MTKKLAELFNVDEVSVNATTDDVNSTTDTPETAEPTTNSLAIATMQAVDLTMDKIDEALPAITDLDATDSELDELADLAKAKFNDLIDLGMNVEPRVSGTIFQTAGVLLGHAISAKQAKIDKKLRIIALQIQKAKLDQSLNKKASTEEPDEIEGKATVVDRNSLLKTILADMKKPKV